MSSMKQTNGQFVQIVGTGGTISSRYDPERGGHVSTAPVEAISELIDKNQKLPPIQVENFSTVPSFEMRFGFIEQLIRRLGALVESDDLSGIVVTQGTDTLEETSFLADLLIESEKPIVFTGAQLAQDHPQTDGPRNLLDAVRAAACPNARGMGVMVAFNGQLHAARDVQKLHTSAVETFQSPEIGPLGFVDGNEVIFYRRPLIRRRLSPASLDKRVELIRLAMGMDGRVIELLLQSGIDGLVVEAFGRGNVTAEVGLAIKKAISSGIPVVVSSRCIAGRVQPIYRATSGGGADLAAADAIFAGNLRGPKARLLLMAALADPEACKDLPALFAGFAP
jgi:L-asparaginase